MNAAARQPLRWCRDALRAHGYPSPTGRRSPFLGTGSFGQWTRAFCVAGLGVGAFGGYFPRGAGSHARSSVSFQPRRLNAQTTSSDVQSGAGVASYRKRSERLSTQLPVMLGVDRAIARAYAAATSVSRHAQVYVLRAGGAVYSRRCITTNDQEHSAGVPLHEIVAPGKICRGRLRCGDQPHRRPPTEAHRGYVSRIGTSGGARI
jgi:hypothetical protein